MVQTMTSEDRSVISTPTGNHLLRYFFVSVVAALKAAQAGEPGTGAI